MGPHSAPGAKAAQIAARQHGVITTAQLASAGINREGIRHRVRAGWLHRIHRGVYAFGNPALSGVGRLSAAVLACGEGAILSYRTAAVLWGLLQPDGGPIHISMPGRHIRCRAGICVHRIGRIDRRHLRKRDGFPLTSPSLTILDLGAIEPAPIVEAALNEALKHRLTSRVEMTAVVAGHMGHSGLAIVSPLLAGRSNDDFSRSEAERRLWKLIQLAGLPMPRRNIRVHGHELDFYWPEIRLNVEMDGYQWHSTKDRLNQDRKRDADLNAVGIQVIRFSYDQLNAPERLVARLASAIAIAADRSRRAA